MSPVVFICETKSENPDDIAMLGGYLEGLDYEVHSRRDLCSPTGQRFMADRPPDDDRVVLVCPRQLGRSNFAGILSPEWDFFSFRLQGEPKALANHIHSEVVMVSWNVLRASPKRKVMVIGGGVGGVYAALDIAEQGYPVVVVERDPSIGGIMAALDKTFPTMDCSI
jgi:NADPH-dependent 2,4-dienoyl-CoA reductase/sulfur reductase-like enzyme